MTSATALHVLDTIATAFVAFLRLFEETISRPFEQATESVVTLSLVDLASRVCR
jgi:hypothetical protein